MNSNSNIRIPGVMSDYQIGISGCDVGMVTCNTLSLKSDRTLSITQYNNVIEGKESEMAE